MDLPTFGQPTMAMVPNFIISHKGAKEKIGEGKLQLKKIVGGQKLITYLFISCPPILSISPQANRLLKKFIQRDQKKRKTEL